MLLVKNDTAAKKQNRRKGRKTVAESQRQRRVRARYFGIHFDIDRVAY